MTEALMRAVLAVVLALFSMCPAGHKMFGGVCRIWL